MHKLVNIFILLILINNSFDIFFPKVVLVLCFFIVFIILITIPCSSAAIGCAVATFDWG
jgi:hypothetical protein